jgi:hypothetical protein
MKLHLTLLTIAVGGLFSASAFAQSVPEDDNGFISSYWSLSNIIGVSGNVGVTGTINVSTESGAVTDQDQFSLLNLVLGDGDNFSSASGDAMNNASGNIGANIASGSGNLQANDAALSAVDGGLVFASAMVFSSQVTGANIATDFPSGPDNQLIYDAHVTDRVLAHASGNIGLNVASGVGNAQTNALAASVNSAGTIAKASADSDQHSVFNVILALHDLDNTAYMDGDALNHAMGNIGVNIASGAGNAQHNGLAIASATSGP